VFRETFQSADSVRENGGSISAGITFSNGKCYMNDASSRITYKPFKINSNTTFRLRYRILNGTTTLGSESSPCFGVYSAVNSRYYITFDNNGYIGVMVSGAGTSSGIVPDYNEHEIVITRTAFYMDGVLVTTIATGAGTPNAQLIIGSLGSLFNGVVEYSLAEIYNKPLTASEVKLLYNQNLYSNLPAVITDNTPNCFEGNNAAYIEVNDSDLLSFGDGAGNDQPFWMSCWVYINTFAAGMGFINKLVSGSVYEYGLYYNGFFVFNMYSRNTLTPRVEVSILTTPKTGFSHITVQYDLNNVYGYINGVLVKTQAINPAYGGTYIGMTPTTAPVRIGYWQSTYPTNNKIWDARIGTGTLTTQQIQDIYQGKRVGSERLWLPLCENAGNTRFDVSGNNLHGTLKGTQDGKYNVGKQNKFDYYTLFGGSSKGNVSLPINTSNTYFIQIPSVYYKSVAFRFLPNFISVSSNTSLILGGTLGGSSVLYPTFEFRPASSCLTLRTNSGFLLFDGSENSVNVPITYFNDSKVHTIIAYISGLTVNLVVDGVYKGYVTTTIGNINILGTTGLGCLGGVFGWQGYVWDFRTWDNEITQEEALKYHNDTMTVSPSHKYSLTGDNPAMDLIGTNHGTIGFNRPLAIPLLASNQQPVLPAMTDVTTTLPVVQRSFREVFRLNANKGIVDQYGEPITVNGTILLKQFGKSKGIYQKGGNSNNLLVNGNNILPQLTDGLIVKTWIIPNRHVTYSPIVSIQPTTGYYHLGTDGPSTFSLRINSASNILAITYAPLREPVLLIACVEREKYMLCVFSKNGLVGYSQIVSQYMIPLTNTNIRFLIDGSGLNTSIATILDLSISTAGILSLEEATNIFSSEKNNFLP